MRVLINALQAGNRSGTGRYTTELVQSLDALSEPELDLAVLWPRDLPPPDAPDVRVIPSSLRGLRRIASELTGLEAAVEEADPDLVHYPANIGPLWCDAPVLVTAHDLSYAVHPEWFRFERALYYRHVGRWTARSATRIAADSQATAKDLASHWAIPRDRVDVIHLGVSDRFAPAAAAEVAAVRNRFGLPERFLLFVGTVEPRKNIGRIVQAWDRIADDVPQALVIAGRSGWKTAPLEAAIAQHRRAERLFRIDYVPEDRLPALLSAADCFVWPSLYEGFGLPPLEALACGTPVVASDRSSLPEVLEGAATLVDPEDVTALAEAMAEAVTGPGHDAQGLCEHAARFSWNRCARETLAAYRRTLA